jgi:hypothetical protein
MLDLFPSLLLQGFGVLLRRPPNPELPQEIDSDAAVYVVFHAFKNNPIFSLQIQSLSLISSTNNWNGALM